MVDALDVAGFTLGDGRRVSVLRDWRDAAHANHLHLEMGGGHDCR